MKIPPTRRYRAKLNAQQRYKHNPTVRLPQVYETNPEALIISMEKISGKTLIEILKDKEADKEERKNCKTGRIVLRAIHKMTGFHHTVCNLLHRVYHPTFRRWVDGKKEFS